MLPSLRLQEIDHYVHLERIYFAIIQQQLKIIFLTSLMSFNLSASMTG